MKVPYKNLQVVSCNYRGNVKRCMMEMIQCWLNNTPDAKWSTVVQALAKLGNRRLANKIAQDYGTYVIAHLGEMMRPRARKREIRSKKRWGEGVHLSESEREEK